MRCFLVWKLKIVCETFIWFLRVVEGGVIIDKLITVVLSFVEAFLIFIRNFEEWTVCAVGPII